MEIAEFVKENIKKAVNDIYNIDIYDILVEHPDKEMWGDFSTNISLKISKLVKQSPMEIANKLCYKLRGYELTEVFEEVYYVQPGFINFRLSKEWLQNVPLLVNTGLNDYGKGEIGEGKRIALEHSNVNPNKATHIGHLRNACVGQFVERVYEFLGYNVEVQYYSNDLGVQVATSMMGVEKIKDIHSKDYEKYDHYAWDIYSRMETLLNNNADLALEREDLLKKLEDPNHPISKKQKKLAFKILVENLKTFQDLGFDYDVVVNESDIVYLKLWEKTFEMLKNNDNIYLAKDGVSKGCWLVRMSDNKNSIDKTGDNYHEEDKIIVRSNGVPNYTGKDIAYHMWKFGLLGIDFNYVKLDTGTQAKQLWITSYLPQNVNENITFTGVDIVFDVIDVKQTYAIEAVKTSLAYLGFKDQSTNMKHINYGFVYLSRGTAGELGIDISDNKDKYGMSGRKGWGIKIDDFIKMVDKKLLDNYDATDSLRIVRNGAIKFEMLKYNTFQDLVFDLKDSLNIKGYSGPYIQYTFARTNSLLEKSQGYLEKMFNMKKELLINSNLNEKELSLLRWIYRFPEIVRKSALEFAPNTLCEFLFELCHRFNSFYNDEPILNASTDKEKFLRLNMTKSVNVILRNGLFLLGIEAPSRM